MKQIFISGTSSGIGLELARHYLKLGWRVFGLSRRISPISDVNFHWEAADLQQIELISPTLKTLFVNAESTLDLAVLNAGVLGKIEDLSESKFEDLEQVMQVNMWANKSLIDGLLQSFESLHSVVAISSGAAVNGNRGWGGYSLSKAALNMLIKLYAAECPETHFSALAPGLVDTRMQDHLCSLEQDELFPSLKKLKAARGSDAMPTPELLATKLAQVLSKLPHSISSGEFCDLRQL